MKLLLSVVILYVHMCTIQADVTAVSEAINKFSKALYLKLKEQPGNLVVSPFSVEAVVAMLLLGMQGDTKQQVTRALFVPETRSEMAEGFKSLLASLQTSQNVTLDIANKIYIDDSFHIKDEFRNDTANYFNSTTEQVNIAGKTEEVRLIVNNWAANKTHDKIKNLLAPGVLSSDVVMILLNAIYFKGFWETPFDKKLTKDKPFFLNSDLSKNVSMMNIDKNLQYTELDDLNVQVLKLPYKGGKFSMLIFLPHAINGLDNLELNLDKLNVSKVLKKLSYTEVVVSLPRFKILSSINLKEPLTKVGMGELFSPGANFSGVTDGQIQISKALQKAFIEVNEEGTEAAAVTALIAVMSSLPPPPKFFTANHPFIYMIVEEDTQTVLFMGRVLDPSQSD